MSTRQVLQDFFHQGPTKHDLDSCAQPATVDARYQTTGDPGVWYGSSMERGAWSELLRHWSSVGVSPFEVRRRVGRATVHADVLDLTDPAVQTALGITSADLVGDDYARCQAVASAARAAGADGLLGPSAAMPGCTTIAIFAPTLPRTVNPQRSRVQRPPASLFRHIGVIRLIGPDAPAVTALLRRLRDEYLHQRKRSWRR